VIGTIQQTLKGGCRPQDIGVFLLEYFLKEVKMDLQYGFAVKMQDFEW